MIYRRYRAEDLTALSAIEERCFVPQLRFTPTYLRQLIKRDETATWVAEDDGTVVGFAIVEWGKSGGGTGGYLQIIEVLPEWRGHGIDTRLMSLAEASASNVNAHAMLLHVDAEDKAAIRLYERCGYRRRGGKGHHSVRGRAALLYMKDLGQQGWTWTWNRRSKATKTLLPLLLHNM